MSSILTLGISNQYYATYFDDINTVQSIEIVFAQTGLHADGTIIEGITVGIQDVDMSYSRIPNGTGNFVINHPTFGFNNESPLVVAAFEKEMEMEIKYYPNPMCSTLNIENSDSNINTIKVVSMLGKTIYSNEYNNASNLQLNMSSFSKGTYFVTINETKVIKVLKQ